MVRTACIHTGHIPSVIKYRGAGVGIEMFHCKGVLISGCWNREVPLYTEVSSLQGVEIEGPTV